MKKILIILSLLISPLIFAEDSKLIKIDLDVDSTVIIKADLDQDDLYYYIDKTACLCYFYRLGSSGPAMATVPCQNLKKHKKLDAHLNKCNPHKAKLKKIKKAVSEEVPSALKMEEDKEPSKELKVEEKKKEKT